MKNKKLFFWVLIMAVAILVSLVIILPSGLAFSGNKAYRENTQINSEVEEIVKDFYNGYIQYDGNPLVDKAYQANPFLSDDFITFLDEFTSDGMMYDPILCAQDFPQSISVGDPIPSDDQVIVPVKTSFEGHHFEVELKQVDGEWKIDSVRCSIK